MSKITRHKAVDETVHHNASVYAQLADMCGGRRPSTYFMQRLGLTTINKLPRDLVKHIAEISVN